MLKMRMKFRASAFALGLTVLLAPALGLASPVTYTLTSGQLSSVQVGTTASGSPCPIGSGNCLQGGSLALTSASITIDAATGQLLSVSIGITTTGTIQLGGFNGLQSVTFANTSLVSTGVSLLTSPQVQANGDVIYSFGFQATVSSTATPLGGSATGIQFASGAGGLLTLHGSELALQIFGADIGVVCGVGNACQPLKADFSLTANTAPIPEPAAFAAFGAGLALVLAANQRRRRL